MTFCSEYDPCRRRCFECNIEYIGSQIQQLFNGNKLSARELFCSDECYICYKTKEHINIVWYEQNDTGLARISVGTLKITK